MNGSVQELRYIMRDDLVHRARWMEVVDKHAFRILEAVRRGVIEYARESVVCRVKKHAGVFPTIVLPFYDLAR